MLSKFKITAIIPAGGVGMRMNAKLPKQFIDVNNAPIIVHTIKKLSKCKEINDIIVAVPDDFIAYFNDIVNDFNLSKVSKILCGGDTRQQTVYKCLLESKNSDYVLIHDAVRPFINVDIIKTAIKYAAKEGASSVGAKAVDTLKTVDKDGFVNGTVDREKIWQIQTPQIFKTDIILEAHKKAMLDNLIVTDDCAIVEKYGTKVKMVENNSINLKITYEDDLKIMEALTNEL